MSAFWSAFLATTAIDLVELAAIIFVVKKLWNSRTELRLLSFAAGVLLSTVFLDLLPEAVKVTSQPEHLFKAVLIAMLGLFLLERLLQRDHSHEGNVGHEAHHHPTASRYFIIFGDGLHSTIDGVAIATAFIASTDVGIVTTLAVLAHEVPHQVGDYSILVRRGVSKWRAMIVNYNSALAALVGVGLTFIFRETVEQHLGILIAATAGMLLYIATVNLLPEVLHGRQKGRWLYGAPFVTGVALIALLAELLPA